MAYTYKKCVKHLSQINIPRNKVDIITISCSQFLIIIKGKGTNLVGRRNGKGYDGDRVEEEEA